ncbi:MAG TPA: protein kinase, partial [bacterium]
MSKPILDKFSIVNSISTNVLYSLYEAVDRETKEQVFLKLIDQRFSKNENGILRVFVANAILNATACPNICKLHGFGPDRQYYYIATEHIDMDNWFSLKQENAPVSYDKLLEILTKIAMTLRHAHLRGVTHGLL